MVRVAVVGGGWAGLAAAIELVEQGCEVTLIEMAGALGGRARSIELPALTLDNGQHVLIGAYAQCLKLMRKVGAEPDQLLYRMPLCLRYADGSGLALPPGPAPIAFVLGVMRTVNWPLTARLTLLIEALRWRLTRFECDEHLSVAALTHRLPHILRAELIEPLCVAALNTPASQASAQVFLRVLHDALFGGRGAADLLLPRAGLSQLLPDPAKKWLQQHRATLQLGTRVDSLHKAGDCWVVNDTGFDAVVLACSAKQAATLTADTSPNWAATAECLNYEPIVTVYLESRLHRLPAPMLAMRANNTYSPAQFAIDLGRLDGTTGLISLVVSGASPWLPRGLDEIGRLAKDQLLHELRWRQDPAQPLRVVKVLAEKRATFACQPGLKRPPMQILPRLYAAGDYVAGPYPATLEGAVLSGNACARAVLAETHST